MKACDICEYPISIEHGLYCPQCRLNGKIDALEEHISFLAEFMAGEHGAVDGYEFLSAEAERAKAVQALNILLKECEQ